MSGYLLDTNVLSEVMRKRPSRSVMARLASVSPLRLHTSVVCVMELRYGAARHPRRRLWEQIEQRILPRISVLPFDDAASLLAGDVLAALKRRGETVGVEDVMIRSTALARGLVLVTRNIRHLARIEHLRVESWWE